MREAGAEGKHSETADAEMNPPNSFSVWPVIPFYGQQFRHCNKRERFARKKGILSCGRFANSKGDILM